ncbi:Uncharacterised protein [Cedecea lapagei]|uniref:Head fiber protein n=1 Tax=Cedecea lapagei TaxID=158823 RepID=A0A447V5N5_9ENTR|nr:hypothetical protein [Cedecea lapagei]VEB99974.1 Uncharacterised protein [Cedecea lapagei]
MTERVYGLSGKTVEVAVPGSGGDLPEATNSVLGGVKVGDNIEVEGGTISVPFAQPSRYGVVKIGSRLVGGGDGVINVPVATRATAGVMKAGDTLSFSPDGTIEVNSATTFSPGIVMKSSPVADVETIPVTDIASAQLAIAAMGTTLSELMQALRNAGILEK